MFNKNFYPTPNHLIEKMLEPYIKSNRFEDKVMDFSGWQILEPSAGKGNICDYIKNKTERYNEPDIYCIESEPELQSILKDKGYPVLSDDFLTYQESYFWDLIIMNPPFDNGLSHLFKAMQLAKNTDIVCLLNAETVRNPYTKERKMLLTFLNEPNASYEFVSGGFSDAERKTNVDVVLIRLRLEDPEDTFDYNFNTENVPELDFDFDLENNAVARKDLVGNLQIHYELVMKTYLDELKYNSRHSFYMKNMTSIAENYYDKMYLEQGSDKQKYNYLSKSLKVFMWKQVIKELDVEKYMSAKVKENFEAFIAQQTNVAFTKENVAKFFQMIMNNRKNIWEQAIVDVFDVFTQYAKENRMEVETWKTNERYKISRRLVLPYWVEWYSDYVTDKSYPEKFSLRYNRDKRYIDIDKCIAFILGHRLMHYTTIDYALEEAFKKIGKISVGDKFDNTCETPYFKIKWFKKGTVHLYFKDKKVWDEFNTRACYEKDWLPGPEKTQWEETKRKRRAEKKKQEEPQEELLAIGSGQTDLFD